MGKREKEWKGLRRMDNSRCMFSRRFLATIIGISLICIMSMWETVKAAIQYHENISFSSIREIERLLTFDRFKTVMVAAVAFLYSGSYAQDQNHSYLRNIFSRCTLQEYTLSRILTIVTGSVCAVVLGFWLAALFLCPWMRISDPEGHVISAAFSGLVLSQTGGFLFLTLLGINFGLAASIPALFGFWISVWKPSSYVAIGSAVLGFYFLYATSYLLPDFLSYEALSSNLQLSLSQNPVTILLYHGTFLMIGITLISIGCYHSLKRRCQNGFI